MIMDYEVEDFPGKCRGERFTAEETNVLVREVRARQHIIYGSNRNPPRVQEVKMAWAEIARIVSAVDGIARTGEKCRKRYNDVRRRGNQRMAALKTREYPQSTTGDAENNSNSSFPSEDKSLGFGGLEIGFQAPVKKEPEVKSASGEQESDIEGDNYKEEQQVSMRSRAPSCPRTASVNSLRPEDHPFLDLQQNGFNMLERELLGVRQSISCLNTRLNRIEVLLRPIGHIADSLGRIANAVERLTSQ